MLRIAPLNAPDKAAEQGLFSIATLDKLTIVPTPTTKFTWYDLALELQYGNGVVQAITPAAITWSLSDNTMATLSGSTLAAQKNGLVTVTAAAGGLTTSRNLLLVDPASPDGSEAEGNNTLDYDSWNAPPAGEVWGGDLLANDPDVYSLSLDQAAQIEVDFASLSTSADVLIEVVDSAGLVVATALSTDGALQSISCGLASGVSFLRLTSAGDIDTNAQYFVSWRVDHFIDSPAGADLALAMGGSQTATLYGLDGSQTFTFQVNGQAAVAVNFVPTSPTATYRLTLQNSAGTINTRQPLAGLPLTIKTGLANGAYSLVVAQVTGVDAAHPFTVSLSAEALAMELEPNNTGLQASTLVAGTPLAAMLPQADVDLYRFTLDHPTLAALAFTSSSASADYRLTLYKGAEQFPIDGTLAANGGAVTLNVGLMAGDYLVKIEPNGDLDQEAIYSLSLGVAQTAGLEVEPNDTLVSANGIAPANPRLGRIYSASDQDLYGFTLATATKFSVTLTPAVGTSADYTIAILNGAGQVLSSKPVTNGVAASFTNYQPKGDGLYFMSQTAIHDLNGDGYDDQIVDDLTPTKSEVAGAITGWAKEQVSSGPLYVYLADHGAPNQFLVASGQPMTAAELNVALDSFQHDTGRPVVVIIEACYSGSFVDDLTSLTYERLILTSVDATNPGYLSTDGTTSYSSFLLTGLYKGQSILASLNQTKVDLAANGLPYSKMVPQMVGPVALQGLKVGGDFVLAGIFPEFGGLTAPQTIDAGTTGGVLSLNAQVTSLNGGLSVWAVVVPPDYVPPEVNGDFETPPDLLPKVVLVDEDPTTKGLDGLFMGNYADFKKNGAYTVTFYAKDSDNNLTKSAPLTIQVTGGVEVTTTTTTEAATTTTTTSIPGGTSVTVTLPVSAGWSLLSSTIGFEVATKLGDSGQVVSVWKWADDGQGGAKTWAVYLPGGGGVAYASSKGFLPLSAIKAGEGFWVNGTVAALPVEVTGAPATGDLNLTSGWNLVGLKGAASIAPSALQAVTSVWKWAADGKGGKTWAVYLLNGDGGATHAGSKGFGQLKDIAPGEGFWVNKN